MESPLSNVRDLAESSKVESIIKEIENLSTEEQHVLIDYLIRNHETLIALEDERIKYKSLCKAIIDN